LSDPAAPDPGGALNFDLYLRAGGGFKLVWQIADHGIRLRRDGLSWTIGGERREAGFGGIAEIHLTSGGGTTAGGGDSPYPMMRQIVQRQSTNMSVCRIMFRDGGQLQVYGGAASGLPDAQHSVHYSEFVVRLHERLAAVPAGDAIAFGGGYSLVRYRVLVVALGVMGLMLLGALVATLAGAGTRRAFVLAAASISFWFQWKMVQANAPQTYDPAHVPDELLPAPVARNPPPPRVGATGTRPQVGRLGSVFPTIPLSYLALAGGGLGAVALIALLVGAGTSEAVIAFQPDAARRLLAAIEAQAGGQLRLRRLDLTPTTLTLTTEALQDHVDRQGLMSNIESWTASHKMLFGSNAWDSVSGPEKEPALQIGEEVSSHPFVVRPQDIPDLTRMARDAVQRAALEDPAEPRQMTLLDRAPQTLDGKGGGLHWAVQVTSAQENAEIFFDGNAQYVGADLAGTLRVRNRNLIAGGPDFTDLLHALRTKVGDEAPLAFLRVTQREIMLRTDDTQFKADIQGVSENGTGTIFCHGIQDMMAGRFEFASIDWTLLPTITERAREAVTLPQPIIVVAVALSVPSDNMMTMRRVRAADLRWAVNLRSGLATYARATFDRAGTLISVQPWDDRHACE